MSPTIPSPRWVAEIDHHYLDRFIASGGSSVKFAVCLDGTDADRVSGLLREAAYRRGYLTAHVDGAATKIHLIEQVLASIAGQLPWDEMTVRRLAQFARESDWHVPDRVDPRGFVEQLVEVNDLREDIVSLELQRRIGGILDDRELARDFRLAMMWLAMARLKAGPESDAERERIMAWLTGQLRAIGELRHHKIFTRINRSNARHLLASMLVWVRRTQFPGLVVTLDARRLFATERSTDGTVNYTTMTLLDTYEVLRQFIDSTDDMEGLLLAVIMPKPFLDIDPSSKSRGMGRYPALLNRVFDEVHDRALANPLNALVRLDDAPVAAVTP